MSSFIPFSYRSVAPFAQISRVATTEGNQLYIDTTIDLIVSTCSMTVDSCVSWIPYYYWIFALPSSANVHASPVVVIILFRWIYQHVGNQRESTHHKCHRGLLVVGQKVRRRLAEFALGRQQKLWLFEIEAIEEL